MMKIAISGKGGVGKSTLTGALSLLIAAKGKKVLAVDADPDANLAAALGIPASEQGKIVTIARQKALIEERTGGKTNSFGQMFKLNPDVSDIADTYGYSHEGVSLLVLGAIEGGGSGCACPENTLLKALVQELVLRRDEILLMDMEPGIEHLGRATVSGVDALIIVVEPGQRSINSVKRISQMAGEIGLSKIYIVLNKVRSPEEEAFVRDSLQGLEILGIMPYSERLLQSDRDGMSVLAGMDEAVLSSVRGMADRLELEFGKQPKK